MLKNKVHGLLSYLVLIAMLCALIPGATLLLPATPAFAATYYIDTVADLQQLATDVNSGTTYSGDTFILRNDLDLSGIAWNPIGGNCSVDGNGVPTGRYFAGIFNGFDSSTNTTHTISNLSISTSTNQWAIGLFGYVNGGTIGNLNVTGSITVNSAAGDVGGIAGYIHGDIYNCQSSVTISATSGSHTGGIAGAAERYFTSPVPNPLPAANIIRYCSNTGSITGYKRVGGIVGAVYCHNYGAQRDNGGYIVDQCFNKGNITCINNSGSKTYVGGIVGYCCGYITSCYNQGNFNDTSSSYKVYTGGIAGILTDYTGTPTCAIAKMDKCYSIGSFSNFMSGYARYMAGNVDTSSVNCSNNFWLLTTAGVGQTFSYGTWTYSTNATTALFEGEKFGIWSNATGTFTNKQVLEDYLGLYSASTGYFAYPDPISYPVLWWEPGIVAPLTGGTPTSSGEDTDLSGAVFLDGVNGNDACDGLAKLCDGTHGPVKTFSTALTRLSEKASTKIIYIINQVTVSGNETWDLGSTSNITGAFVQRSSTYSGYLARVGASGSLTLQDITIDGNKDNFTISSGSLIDVEGGALYIESNALLENNIANGGGAVRIMSGNATMDYGQITNNYAANYGGGVTVFGGSFTINGGDISSNEAGTHGGGVYVATGATCTDNTSPSIVDGNTPDQIYP